MDQADDLNALNALFFRVVRCSAVLGFSSTLLDGFHRVRDMCQKLFGAS